MMLSTPWIVSRLTAKPVALRDLLKGRRKAIGVVLVTTEFTY